MSELLEASRPRNDRGRREGRVPTAPMVRVQKKARGRTTGSAEDTRPSLRNGFNGLLRALPGDRALLPPSPQSARLRAPGLSASVGAPGPHGLAVRARVSRPLPPTRPPHPTSTFVTTRTPLSTRRDNEMKPLIWGEYKMEYFCCDDWTAKISLKSLEKLAFRRRGW